ncbi:MAG: sigma-54-dependent Fis family transcriptional regulator, partial [Candidatus Omnitrophica bacterium]|nr:sigma-54-dependent Fis family transcriptional regulator [Candidatus Omnitrophota bacterium]
MTSKVKTSPAPKSRATAQLLVIDDEPDTGPLFSRILGEQGFTVQAAVSGEEGLRILKEKAVDLVLLDVLLPGMNGLETLRRIKTLRPDTAVIMMTGHETVKTAVEAMKLGAYDYLPKPLTPDRLGRSIQQALQVKALEVSSLPQVPRRPTPVTPEEMVGQSLSIVAIFDLVRRIAPQDLTVLIRGESGTGKEMIAQAIHALSPRREKPFVPVDCASLPESLFESELFGYERGAFTGADAPKEGRFEQAEGGTLFLDEIGNLTLTAQAKLLRVLQEREISRLGGKRPIQIDVRILAATNQNLDDLMEKQLFREDLFHRLNVFSISLPPLRSRGEDVK